MEPEKFPLAAMLWQQFIFTFRQVKFKSPTKQPPASNPVSMSTPSGAAHCCYHHCYPHCYHHCTSHYQHHSNHYSNHYGWSLDSPTQSSRLPRPSRPLSHHPSYPSSSTVPVSSPICSSHWTGSLNFSLYNYLLSISVILCCLCLSAVSSSLTSSFSSSASSSSSPSSSFYTMPSIAKIGAIFYEPVNNQNNAGARNRLSSLSGSSSSISGNIQDEIEAEIAFRYAVQRINRDRNILPNTTLVYDIQYVAKDDSFHAAKKTCQMINNGALAIFGPSDDRIGVHVQSVCDALDIPHIESRMHNINIGKEFSINLHPGAYAIAQSLRVLITYLNWTQIAVIYEDDIALIGLQEVVKLPLSRNVQFIYRKTSQENFRSTLIDLRDRGIYTMIVDTRPESLPSFFTAILQVQMNENRYHYHFTTFDLEIYDLEDFMYNDVNITTYRLVDYTNPMVRNIIKEMDKYHPAVAKQLLHRNQLIKASVAIMFDSVYSFARGLHQFNKNLQYSSTNPVSNENLANGGASIALAGGSALDIGQPSSSSSSASPSGGSNGGPSPPYNNHHHHHVPYSPYYHHQTAPFTISSSLNSLASCSNETPWTNGLSLYNYIDSISFSGLTGKVSFKEGIRANMRMDLVKLRNFRMEKVGEWYHSESLLNITNQEAFNRYKQKNVTLRVTTVLMDPYIRRIRNNSGPLGGSSTSSKDVFGYEGFCIDLLNAISKDLSFNYEIYEVEDGRFGAMDDKTGEWRGLVRELIDKRADLAIAPLTISFARENVIDFTKPFMNLGIGILFKMPTSTPTRLFSFMSPLAVDIWLYVVAAYVLVSATLFIVARFSPYEWTNPHPCIQDSDIKENQFSLADSFWFTVVTLMKQGCDMNPRSFSTRIIGAIWWFFTLILISSYTANLAAFLTVERITTPIESVEDLATQSKIKYGSLKDGSTMAFFRDSKFPTYQKMWEFMNKHPETLVPSYELGRERVLRGDYAFLMESTMIDFMVQRDCNLVQIGGLLDSKGYGIATQIGSEWKDKISLSILELQEKGEIQMVYDKWWKSPGLTCIRDELKNKDGKASPLGLDNIGGVFVVLLLGLLIALLTAFYEFLSGKNQKSETESIVGGYSDGNSSSQVGIY